MKRKIFAIMLAVIALVTFLVVPISATVEGGTEQQAETETFWDKYPFFNILPFTWQNIAGEHNGVTITVEADGTIRAVGTINAPGENVNRPGEMLVNYYDIVLYEGEGIELPEVVTLSSNDVTRRSYVYFYLDNSSRINLNGVDSITGNTEGGKLIKLVLRLRFDGVPIDMTIRPMLNAGSVAYPYQPYAIKDQIIGEGYEAGYTEGETEGYTQGKTDGYNQGYDVGYLKGHVEGYTKGQANGYNEGKAYGVNIGIKQGEQSTVTKSFVSILGEIAMTPYTAISQIFDFEIFGLNVAGIVFQLITVAIVVVVVSWIFKFKG